MTTREHENLQKFFNTWEEVKKEEKESFDKLQDMNAQIGSGVRYCSAYYNLECIRKAKPDSEEHRKAEYLYEQYTKALGKEELYWELGGVLAELGFWKGRWEK